MPVVVPDAAARIVWEALRGRLADQRAANGGGHLHPDAQQLLDQLRQAAYRHMSESGHDTRPPGDTGRGDSRPAAAAETGHWVPTSAAAAALGITDRHVRRLAAAGHLPARRLGWAWAIRVDPEDLTSDSASSGDQHHPGHPGR